MKSFDELKNRALKGIFTLTARRLILKIIDTVGLIYLARALTEAHFGIFGIISFVVFTLLSFFSDIGLGAALIQKEEVKDEDLATTFTIQQLLVTTILIFAWILAPYLANLYSLGDSGAWLIRTLSLSLFLTSFKTIPSILLERKLRFELLVIPEIIETLTYNSIAVLMAINGYGVWSLVVAVSARTLFGAIVLNFISPWRLRWQLSRKSASELLKFGVPYQLNNVLALIKDNLTPTIIAVWYGPSAVGYVNVAQNISSRPLEISTIVSRITFPTYSRLQQDKERLKRWLEKSVYLMSLIYFPAIFGLLATAKPILLYLYANHSDKWLPAYPALIWFLVAALPVMLTTTYTNAIFATGHPKKVLLLMIIYTILTWAIGLPLIRVIGYTGIAITITIITYLTLPLVFHLLRSIVKVNTLGNIWKPLLVSMLMSLAVVGLRELYVDSLPTLIITIIVGAIFYLGLIWLVDHKRLRVELTSIASSLLTRK